MSEPECTCLETPAVGRHQPYCPRFKASDFAERAEPAPRVYRWRCRRCGRVNEGSRERCLGCRQQRDAGQAPPKVNT